MHAARQQPQTSPGERRSPRMATVVMSARLCVRLFDLCALSLSMLFTCAHPRPARVPACKRELNREWTLINANSRQRLGATLRRVPLHKPAANDVALHRIGGFSVGSAAFQPPHYVRPTDLGRLESRPSAAIHSLALKAATESRIAQLRVFPLRVYLRPFAVENQPGFSSSAAAAPR